MTLSPLTDQGAIRATIAAFFGPRPRFRVFRGGSLRKAFWMQKVEDREPGGYVFDELDLIEEERLAYRRRTWTVESIVDRVVTLRDLGHRDIKIGRDGRITVRCQGDELCGRETWRHFPVDDHAAPVDIRDRRTCCDPLTLYNEVAAMVAERRL